MTTASPFQIPVPGCWNDATLTATQRSTLEMTAALADGTGSDVDQVAAAARHALDEGNHTAELVLLATRMEEVHGADVGYTVSMPAVVPDEDAGRGATKRVRMRATVLVDLILEQHQIPPAYLSEALLIEPKIAVLVGRITMVDSYAQTVTVELFSKTDQYEVTVPDSIVLDETCNSQSAVDRRLALLRTLRREFEPPR